MADMSAETPTEAPSLSLAERPPASVSAWITHIRERDMPAFGATVSAVRNVTGDDRSSASRLAQVILQDAALTTKVLKLANSAFYNPSRHSVSTISRAIVVLGFDLVAEIALGVSLVDALLTGGVRDRVVQEMARCFHGAVQARAIARLRRDPRAEEIFIATLLARVGDMAFWCFGGSAAEQLDTALAEARARPPEEVQMAELGFRLHQLSVGLAREWRLGSLLSGVLEARGRPDPAEQAVLLGQKVAVVAEQGWASPAMEEVLAELVEYSGAAPEDLRPLLTAEAEHAARIVSIYGAPEAARCIPAPALVMDAEAGAAAASKLPLTGPNPELQLRILRELSSLIVGGGSLNEVLQLALEGILRGVGLGRVLFALVTANRQQLVGKSALGAGAETFVHKFVFTLGASSDDLFDTLTVNPRPALLGQVPGGPGTDRLRAVTGEVPGCVAPILAQGRMVGLFYADHGTTGRAVDQETFDAVCHFVQQVSLAFLAASARRA